MMSTQILDFDVTFEDIEKAYDRISKYITYTPVVTSSTFDQTYGKKFYFKSEQLQKTGSFKARGALNAVLCAKERNPKLKGVITLSSGNHGIALAWAASINGIGCCVLLPENAVKSKVEAIEEYGADVVLCGPNLLHWQKTLQEHTQKLKYHHISSCEYDVIAGQGTIALEFLKQVHSVDAILISTSSGGMAAGICIYAKLVNPKIKVYLVEPDCKMLENCLREEMDYLGYFDYADAAEMVENVHRERVVRDRQNPLTFYDDMEFLNRYRLTKATVVELVDMIAEPLGRPGQKLSDIPPLLQTMVTLRYFATGAFLKLIGDAFGIHVSTVSRIIKNVSFCIAQKRSLLIKFPRDGDLRQVQNAFMNLGQLPGIVGAIDCTHIPIQSPAKQHAEIFRNRKGYFSMNVQAICDSNNKFTNIVARWPGSTHDSRIFENSSVCAKFESGEYTGILLGDSGYPLKPYLLTPVLRPTSRSERRYNYHLSRIRVRIENLFGVWKRRFPCLRYQLRLQLRTSLICIVACAVLHNLAVNRRDPTPEEERIGRPAPENVDAVPIDVNGGGQAVRNLMIRRFV